MLPETESGTFRCRSQSACKTCSLASVHTWKKLWADNFYGCTYIGDIAHSSLLQFQQKSTTTKAVESLHCYWAFISLPAQQKNTIFGFRDCKGHLIVLFQTHGLCIWERGKKTVSRWTSNFAPPFGEKRTDSKATRAPCRKKQHSLIM